MAYSMDPVWSNWASFYRLRPWRYSQSRVVASQLSTYLIESDGQLKYSSEKHRVDVEQGKQVITTHRIASESLLRAPLPRNIYVLPL